jgi:putative ABC transport system permease protein
MHTAWQDLRYAVRMLLRNSGLNLAAIATLALGMAATTCVFSVLKAVLIKPLPYHEPERLVWLANSNPSLGVGHTFLNSEDISDYREEVKSFTQVASWDTFAVNLSGGRKAERVEHIYITPNFFQTLGIRPLLGRDFTPGDVENDDVVIISYGLWQRLFGGDPDVIGRKVVMTGWTDDPYVIIGVTPADMEFPAGIDMFSPYEHRRGGRGGKHLHRTIARLKPDATIDQAQAEINVVARRQATQFPETNRGWEVTVVPFRERFFGRVTIALPVLFGAALCVLLIACANVANLQLVQAAGRAPEIAVRLALGASRRRIVCSLLIENLLLFAIGGAAGLLVALGGMDLLQAWGAASVPRLKEAAIDTRALAFAALLSAVTGALFGLIPALRSSNVNLIETLKRSGSSATPMRRQRVHAALVASQFALAMTLVLITGLLMKSFIKLRQIDPGFQVDRLLTAGLSLNWGDYESASQRTRIYQRALESVRRLPGVDAASAVSFLPLGGRTMQVPFRIEGREQAAKKTQTLADYRIVTPAFFETLRVPIKLGRYFTERDNDKAPVVYVINDAFARNYFPGGNPIGERLRLEFTDDKKHQPRGEIIGMVGDVKHRSIEEEAFPTVYVCHLQNSDSLHNFMVMYYIVRTRTDPRAIAEGVRRELQSVDPNQVVFNVRPMEYLIADAQSERRLTLRLFTTLAALALVLAATGIYGVMSYSVERRTREIGIRIALGAQRDNLMQWVLGQGMRIALLGMGIGAAITFASTRLINSLLFGVSTTDPFTFAVIGISLALVAMLACWMPARRATNVDPMIALRSE